MPPSPKYLDDSIPFAEGHKLIVEIEIDPRGTTDDYIDNLISLTVDVEGTDNIVRCDRAPLLAFDTCSRPLHENEPNPQETMEAINKLESEALLEEQKVILGWLVDFRRLLIRLPENKFVAWLEAIRKMIKVARRGNFIGNFGSETPSFYDGFTVKYYCHFYVLVKN